MTMWTHRAREVVELINIERAYLQTFSYEKYCNSETRIHHARLRYAPSTTRKKNSLKLGIIHIRA